MATYSVFYIGTESQVAHHAEPLRQQLSVKVAAPAEVVQLAKPGDVAIAYSEHFRQTREAIRQLKKKGVATLYAIDGILEWRNAWENRSDEPASPFCMRPVLSDKVACIGHSQARVLASWGNTDKIEVVGLPRLDRLVASSTAQLNRDDLTSKEDSNSFRILITTAKWPGFTPEQMEKAKQSLLDLKHWIVETKVIDDRTIEPTWRLTRGLAEEIGVDNKLNDVTGVDMISALRNADALVTTPSTAMLEAMCSNVPVALLDYNSVPHYVPAAWEMFAQMHIDPIMRAIAKPSPERLDWQAEILTDSLQTDQPAASRLVQLVNGMSQISAEAFRRGEVPSYPASILDEVSLPAASRSFSHANVYADSSSFQKDDRLQLQVELADAQREIELREGEITQLKSELAEAHSIFEQIHQHPVAGPVVRLRQKLIDWLQRRKRDQGPVKAPANSSAERVS